MHNFEVVTISSIQHGSTHIHPKSRNLGNCDGVWYQRIANQILGAAQDTSA